MIERVLYVGDPHITVPELEDGRRLLELIRETCQEHEVGTVVFVGDEYHHHGVVHLEVMDFWTRGLKTIFPGVRLDGSPEEGCRGFFPKKVCLMVGNHDRPGAGARVGVHALMAHQGKDPRVVVVDTPTQLCPGVMMVPYVDTPEEFLTLCDSLGEGVDPPIKVLVCHQSFNGGTYENGMRVMNAIEAGDVPFPFIISGHIHAPQRFDKVWYLGAPRWRLATDANVDRHLWVVDHDESGDVVATLGIPTGGACRRIWDLRDTEGQPLSDMAYDGHKDDVRVLVEGSQDYLRTRVPPLEAKGFKVRTLLVGAAAAPRVRESEGIPQAFQKFLGGYQSRHGTPREVLARLAEERLANAR